ncbi:MAG: hypothetical protein U0610_04305 [bacterium]
MQGLRTQGARGLLGTLVRRLDDHDLIALHVGADLVRGNGADLPDLVDTVDLPAAPLVFAAVAAEALLKGGGEQEDRRAGRDAPPGNPGTAGLDRVRSLVVHRCLAR